MALERLKRRVARFPPLTRLLFGVYVPHRTAQGHWDFATLVLFEELKRRVKPQSRILEIGTGEVGTLSVAMARRVSAQYMALDLAEEAVDSARRVAAFNRVSVEFLQSDLLAAVPSDRSFDLTFFNPPYLPRGQSDAWGRFGEPSRVFDGGEDGLDVVRAFFERASTNRERLGAILIGFNRNAINASVMVGIAQRSGFSRTAESRAFHPGTVLTFEATSS